MAKNPTPRLAKLLEESNEAYYWMGFLIADGHFNFKKNVVNLSLAAKDLEHLKKYGNFLNVEKEPTKYPVYNGYRITLNDRINFTSLVNKYKIQPRKTYNPVPVSEILDDDKFLCALIGFIDGDGYIAKRCRRPNQPVKNWQNALVITVHGSWYQEIINIVKRIESIYGIKLCATIINQSGLASWATHSTNFLQSLKLDCLRLNLPHLDRKWSRIDENKITIKQISKKDRALFLQLFNQGKTNREICEITGWKLKKTQQYAYYLKKGEL